MPSTSPPASYISAISSKPFSISLKSKQSKLATQAPSTLNPKKRPHSSLAHESDSEPDTNPHSEPQLLSSFDHAAGGAILANGQGAQATKKALLVIPAQKNRDWREESRKKRAGRNLLPQEVQDLRAGRAVDASADGESEPVQYGLTFIQRDATAQTESIANGDMEMQGVQATSDEATKTTIRPLTADEEALEALKGTSKKPSTLIIGGPSSANPNAFHPNETSSLFTNAQLPALSEAQLFKADVASRPDSASLAEYNSIPVEEFGAALLRGMGWKGEIDADGNVSNGVNGVGGKANGGKARVVERRPALLGIGAKEVPKELMDELGAWGKGAQGSGGAGKKGRKEVGYNPVVLRDKVTGELVTEEELEKRVREGRERAEEEMDRKTEKERRKRRDREDERNWRYEDESDDSDRKDRERRREKERERERERGPKHSRHSRYDDDYESDARDRRRRRDEDDSARDSGRDRKHRERDRGRYDDYDDAYEKKDKDRRRRERDEEGRDRRRDYDDRERKKYRD